MVKKQFVKSRNVVKVTYELPADVDADAVYLICDADGWDPVAFDKLKNGKWKLAREYEPGSRVQFRYQLRRASATEFVNDDSADGAVANDHGTENAVLAC